VRQVVLWLLLLALPALARPTTFIRTAKDAEGKPASLQVSISRYAGPGYTVDLVAAVHVGEKSYYRALNQAFKNYDAVLFELIADPEVAEERKEAYRAGQPSGFYGRDSSNPLAAMQTMLCDLLTLQYQLELVEYGAPNFVHADLTPAEFAKSWKDKGESVNSLLVKLFQLSLEEPELADNPALDELSLLGILTRGPTARERILLRQVFAVSFEHLDRFNEILNGKNGSTIVSARNDRALKVLAQQVKKGKKRLAIFYGAAHLPDMEKKLVAKGKHKLKSQRWLVAWDLRLPAKKKAKKAS